MYVIAQDIQYAVTSYVLDKSLSVKRQCTLCARYLKGKTEPILEVDAINDSLLFKHSSALSFVANVLINTFRDMLSYFIDGEVMRSQ